MEYSILKYSYDLKLKEGADIKAFLEAFTLSIERQFADDDEDMREEFDHATSYIEYEDDMAESIATVNGALKEFTASAFRLRMADDGTVEIDFIPEEGSDDDVEDLFEEIAPFMAKDAYFGIIGQIDRDDVSMWVKIFDGEGRVEQYPIEIDWLGKRGAPRPQGPAPLTGNE